MISSIRRWRGFCQRFSVQRNVLDRLDFFQVRLWPTDGRFVSLHAFVDESRRNNTYLLGVAVVSPGQLTKLRKLLMGLRMPNQRELHFKKETPARRKQILSALTSAVVHVDIYLACCRRGKNGQGRPVSRD